jgi:hypothetical protein
VSKRTASWLAWSMCALSLALTAVSLLLLALIVSYPDAYIFDHWFDSTLAAISFSPVGAVIASRSLPSNLVGWLFCATGLVFAVVHFASEYAIYALLAAPGSLPAGEPAAWISSWLWVVQLGLVAFLFLLFPTGGLPGSRWRWFARLTVLSVLVGAVMLAFSPGPIIVIGSIQNPLGVEGLPNVYGGFFRLVELVMNALMLVALISLFIRLRRARQVERQQIKWFVYATALTLSGAILTYPVSDAIGSVWLKWIAFVPLIVGVLAIPIAMGIAILRYRLYEIDLIINRTLVYGLLTAALAIFYFGSVTALQSLFSLLTGQGNTLAIVVSTLAIAALFNPLRRRFQGFIDHRFYRRKYDARTTLEAFGSKLRDETDLEKLCEDLGEVVDETMQPSHISLWLRFPASPISSESSSEVRSRSSSKQSAPPSQ